MAMLCLSLKIKQKAMIKRIALSSILLAVMATSNIAVSQEEEERSIFDLSLEELINIEVTTASRRAQRISDARNSNKLLG